MLLRLARVLACWIVGAAALGCAAGGLPPSEPGPALGRSLPEFTRRTLAGSSISSEALRGKIVVVEFFAQYCKPCWTALPQVQRLAAGDPELVVLGVGEDEFASETEMMAQQLGLSFPVVHDAGNGLAARFRVGKIPATLLLDRSGVVRWQARPGDGVVELRRAVAALRSGG
ncbi:TlpA disulfide reductase family protein [Nannocystis sp.]|uniref:TlpA family protein disulfide reductase n=1 Tax=Nannocystis sp. TaxID=1962667 RepID=UPI0024230E35|nr:TlpA disulfide reductase family protein [Nannocystis sp.]MBK7824542.1 TlpA family protein disulfide reductase [Nannocystis sp.]MBK9753206.1 TlpA family protein disulfide reductase [Nannocystis sp.]